MDDAASDAAASDAIPAKHLLRVKTDRLVPKNVTTATVRQSIEALANAMMVHIALGRGGALQ